MPVFVHLALLDDLSPSGFCGVGLFCLLLWHYQINVIGTRCLDPHIAKVIFHGLLGLCSPAHWCNAQLVGLELFCKPAVLSFSSR